jgi:hypothetical protein
LLFIALLSRYTGLGSFSWPDEQTWLERSAAFVLALERGDLGGTYLSDHPGVVPMWGFGTALALRARLTGDHAALEALAAESYQGDYPAQLAAAATFTVLLTSLAIVAAYALLIPLMGRPGAALAGLFLALDPFYLTHSRIVHVDGILASLMLLSALALLVYLRRPHRRRFLFLSGLLAGLALLTKTPGLFLIPLTALALGLQWLLRRLGREEWGGLGQVTAAFGLWLATAAITFWLVWPAAWTNPFFFVYRIYRASRWGVIVSHGTNFFLGQVVDDPGPLFYLVVLPFRLPPLVLILLPLALLVLILAWRRCRDVRLPLICLAFLLFFTVMVSLAAKKGDRYLLPAFLPAAILAAWTLDTGLEGLVSGLRGSTRVRWLAYAGAAGLLLLVSLLWLRLAPHYGAYFNPLLGGGPAAEGAFAFGQGEGLEMAAEYLNDQADATQSLAVTFYPPQFRYYFVGDATSLRRRDWDGTWLFADYVVFYISQVQRREPTAELVEFFLAQEPEYVARLGGVSFAQVYRPPLLLSAQPPAVEERFQGRHLGGELGLVGLALSDDGLRPGQELYVTLAWQPLVQMGHDYELELRLVDPQGRMLWANSGLAFDGYFPTSWWPPGRTRFLRYRVDLPSDLPAGPYYFLAGARDPATGRALPPHGPILEGWPDSLLVRTLQAAGQDR